MPSTLRIYIFLETLYTNEDMNHMLEHRFFEHEVIKNLENEEHTSISAYAHITWILFKVYTVHHTKERILEAFQQAITDPILVLSPEEQARFIQEWNERKNNESWNLVEQCNFRETFTEIPKQFPLHLSDCVIRQSIVIAENGWTQYQEILSPIEKKLSIPQTQPMKLKGQEFHLVILHRISSLEDVLYEAIYTEFVHEYLKKKFVQDGSSYSIWANSYYESDYIYSGFYWQTSKTQTYSFQQDKLDISEAVFSQKKNIVAFDTLIWHEDHYFAMNVITGFDPSKEQETIQSLSYEWFLEFIQRSPTIERIYSC